MSVRDKTVQVLARSGFVRGAYGVLRKIPGAGGGIEKLVRAALPPGKRLWMQIPGGAGKGLWMELDPRFDVGYLNGDYEPWIQEFLQAKLRPRQCYYDIGAHTGFFAMIAARQVGPGGRVVAFEADPINAARLKANVARNRLEQVTIVEAAVWSSSGQVSFERAASESNRSQGRVSQDSSAGRTEELVTAVQLDEVIFERGCPQPDLIKMDIEGAEWGALQGARRLLGERKARLLCEVHDPKEMGKIQDYLRQFGYAVEESKPANRFYEHCRELYLWAEPA